ncbi:MAG: zinc ribbon domain-containing protein [Methanothermobacter sp.]|nr:zinc ribbon domain-containing protein [Methanothermobacter sp.]
MVYCPYCGEKNSENAIFCKKCGNRLPAIEKKPTSHHLPGEPIRSMGEAVKTSFEWDVAIIAAFIFLISYGILRVIAPPIALWLAAAFSILYLLSATEKKASILPLIIITLLITINIKAFLGL